MRTGTCMHGHARTHAYRLWGQLADTGISGAPEEGQESSSPRLRGQRKEVPTQFLPRCAARVPLPMFWEDSDIRKVMPDLFFSKHSVSTCCMHRAAGGAVGTGDRKGPGQPVSVTELGLQEQVLE